MRKVTSLTAALAFIIILVTSIILYIVPQGRIAYWADWHLLGLSKTDWTHIHINTGLLFLIALALHIYYNWKALMAYLKRRVKQVQPFNREFNIALIITVYCVMGSYWLLPPFNWVMALNEDLKDAAATKYGEPPYGHAELSSLQKFSQKMNLDLHKSKTLLKQAGYVVDDVNMSLAEIGRQHQVPPQQIYQVIQSARIASELPPRGSGGLPNSPPPGTGNLTLADLCAQYGLNRSDLIAKLQASGISAAEDLTLKKIAAKHQMSPSDLYQMIRELSV